LIFDYIIFYNHFSQENTTLRFIFNTLYLTFLFVVLFIPEIAFANSPPKISDIKDENLSKCLSNNMQKMGLHNTNQLRNLKCHGMNISNLQGLEKFTQLETLSLFNNKLTNVNIQTLRDLKHLNIANNKLKKINIVGLSKLETLYLFKNKLVTVDFTGLDKLKKIRITNNNLKGLNISPLISLEKAYFFDNKLEELIVKGLPKLKFIELRQNPMPDDVYDRYDALEGITIIHDGNADDWK